MKLLINGVVYDSTETPILIHFDENEQKMFDMKKFVSTPEETSELQRAQLISVDLFDDINDTVKKYNRLYCKHKNVENYNHGYHNYCRDCGTHDVD